jgi:hypothetical protein
MRSLIISTPHYSGDQIKNNVMGETGSTCGREERYIEGFGEAP